MKKNQIIILVLVIVIIFGGIIGWFLVQKSEIPSGGGVAGEVFSLSGVVSSVDVENNFLMVRLNKEEKETKIVLSDTTELIKIGLPFDQENPPAETTFTPEQTEIKISDFQVGDNVSIRITKNIAGKAGLDNVNFVHILP